MGTLTERPPPRAEPPKPTRERRHRTDRRRTERRLLVLGLLASIVIHALVVVIASRALFVRSQVASPTAARPAAAPDDDVMRAYEITAVAVTDAPAPPGSEERDEPAPDPEPRPEPRPPPAPDAGEADPAAPPPRSTADRLTPRVGDRRLWAPPSDLAPPARPTPMDEARDRIAGRIEMLSDSMVAAMERERRSREWIVEGEDGGKWGVSPGKLHLGDITLPLPIGIRWSAEMRQQIAEWGSIRSQVARESARAYMEERAKAIRERIEKERAEKNGGDGQGGSSDEDPPPD